MLADRFLGAGALLLSVLLHIALGLALILGFETGPAPTPKPAPAVNSLPAVSIDKAQVRRELRRLRQREDADKAAEARRKQELEQLIRQRKKEQARLRQIKQEREAEAARVRRQAQAELEKKRRLEQAQKAAARKKQEAERRAAEKRAAAQREAERRRQEQQRRQREQQLQAELEAEQRARQDQAALAQYTGLIIEAVAGRFNRLGLPGGLSCVIRIRMLAGGQVAEVAIVRSSGNALFDSRAETAVRAASPLPVPANARLFEKMRNIRFTFAP